MQEIRAERNLGYKDDYILGLYEAFFTYMILYNNGVECFTEFIPEYLQLAKELGGGEETKQYALATAIAYTMPGETEDEHKNKCKAQLQNAYEISKKLRMTGPDAAAIAIRYFTVQLETSNSEYDFVESIKSELD